MDSNTKTGGSTITELVDIVQLKWRVPTENLDEVYPGVYIGDEIAAKDIDLLKRMKMTHILNAACAEKASFIFVNTSQGYYTLRNFPCKFLGLSAVDSPTYKLSRHFQQASEFIEEAVNLPQGKILVHCRQGVSRSATLVIIYLMLKQGMTGREAITLIKKKRNIFPNKGFLKEICDLEALLLKQNEQNEDKINNNENHEPIEKDNDKDVENIMEIKKNDNTEIKTNDISEIKENGNTETKENDNAEIKENDNTEIKENGNTEIKENGNTEIKENGNTEIKENGNTEIKENDNTEIKENGNTEINENVNAEIKEKDTVEMNNNGINDDKQNGNVEIKDEIKGSDTDKVSA